ncbi:MAG TPA: hypothetical protein VM534_01155 [Thermoanaerobaculia bacterium]|nr:hypothetical protein [Thermoanaerobaculia bacterium]
MKLKELRFATSFLVVLVAATPLWAAGTKIAGDEFGIELPQGFPDAAKNETSAEVEGQTITTTTYVSRIPTGTFIFAFSDFGVVPADPGLEMAKAKDQLLQAVKGAAKSLAETPFHGHPSMRMVFAGSGQIPQYGRVRLVFAGARLYQVIYLAGSEDALSAPEVSSSFESLSLPDAVAEAPADKRVVRAEAGNE